MRMSHGFMARARFVPAVSLWISLAVLLPSGCQRKASPAWEIVPGRKIGVLDPSEGEQDLAMAYGAANLRPTAIQVGEGETAPGTVLFPDDSLRSIEILWQDTLRRRFPARAILRGSRSLWKLPRGIGLGTSLRELENLNGGPFTLAGFAWDYEGVVFSWAGGALDTVLSGTKLYLAPEPSMRSDSVYAHVLGDREYSSSVAAMQRLNPRVYQIFVDFPPQEIQAGEPEPAEATVTPPESALGQTYEIQESDSGKTFTYPITTRFTIYLDSMKYPVEGITTTPEGVLGRISNVPAVQPPLVAVRYEAVRAGTAEIRAGEFRVRVRVVER